MSEKIINIQDAFLNYMRKNKIPVTVFLLNGVKLTGIIACFDQAVIVLKREGYSQLLYKHAISTFSPHGPISIFDWNGAPIAKRDNEFKEEMEEFEEEEGETDDEEFETEDE